MRRDTLSVFLASWALFAAFVDRRDLESYRLAHAVVESIVERGTYALGGSRQPIFQAPGDTFPYGGRRLPAKQPGLFTLAALPYAALHRLGITYADDYFLAARLVTLATGTLFAALSCAALYGLVTGVWGYPRAVGAFTTASYGLGTLLLPYSGVPHHDVVAAALLLMAVSRLERLRLAPDVPPREAAVAGALLGLTLFVSMLPALVVLVTLAAVAAWRRVPLALWCGLGFALGVLPLAAYNAVQFGNPLVQANMAGEYADTFFEFRPQRMPKVLDIYLGLGRVSVLKYMPVFAAGLLGLFALRGRLAAFRAYALAAFAVHLFFLLNIQAIGYCQYGPRFLLAVLPLVMAGIAGALAVARRSGLLLALLALVASASFVINLVGAVGGSLHCNLHLYAFPEYLGSDEADLAALRRLLPWLSAALGLGSLALGWTWRERRG